jgi:hypothetical protein
MLATVSGPAERVRAAAGLMRHRLVLPWLMRFGLV